MKSMGAGFVVNSLMMVIGCAGTYDNLYESGRGTAERPHFVYGAEWRGCIVYDSADLHFDYSGGSIYSS